jgi:hypothetical protein
MQSASPRVSPRFSPNERVHTLEVSVMFGRRMRSLFRPYRHGVRTTFASLKLLLFSGQLAPFLRRNAARICGPGGRARGDMRVDVASGFAARQHFDATSNSVVCIGPE